jgi:hypothetical protein
MKNKIIILLSLILIVTGVGCAALSSYVTPAELDDQSIDYVVLAGVANPKNFTGYPNLAKAEKLQKDVDSAHAVNQFNLEKLIQKDTLDYSIYKDVTMTNYETAVEREKQLFGENGLLSLGLSMIGAGGFAGLLGLMRKRPGDITPAEAEQALAEATGRTAEELSTKERQMIQLVKGVQMFLEATPERDVELRLKQAMDKAQDTDTQIAVATIKKSV